MKHQVIKNSDRNKSFSLQPCNYYPKSKLLSCVVVLLFVANFSYGDTLTVTDDTDINLNQVNQNRGNRGNVFIRNTGGVRHTFVRFDLSSLPSGILIDQARLRLWVSTVNNPGFIDFHMVLGDWDEDNLTASITPPIDVSFETVEIFNEDQNNYVSVDITDQVQNWLNGIANYGIAILPNNVAPDPNVRLILDSKENPGTSHPMEIEVVLSNDDTDVDPNNELNNSVVLNGTSLEVTDIGGTLTADLSSLIEDADANSTNELNTSLSLNGNDVLELTDSGGTLTADLSSLAGSSGERSFT